MQRAELIAELERLAAEAAAARANLTEIRSRIKALRQERDDDRAPAEDELSQLARELHSA